MYSDDFDYRNTDEALTFHLAPFSCCNFVVYDQIPAKPMPSPSASALCFMLNIK